MTTRTVVIADDDDSLRHLLSHVVRTCAPDGAVEIVEAPDGAVALARVEPLLASPEARVLLLSDHRMPRMSGLELLRAVRQGGGPGRVKLVMLTSTMPPQPVRDELAQLGARVMERPFRLDALRKLVHELVAELVNEP